MIGKKIVAMAIVVFLISVLMVTAIPVSVATAAGIRDKSQTSTLDMTNTVKGAGLASEATQRWQQYGVNCNTPKVYDLLQGDYLIAPSDVPVQFQYVKTAKGMKLEPIVFTPLRPTEDATKSLSATVVAASAPWWELKSSDIFSRFQNNRGWMDNGFKINRLVGDTDNTKDYWEIERFGTAKSKGSYLLTAANVKCYRASSYSCTMEWFDYSPKADTTYPSGGTYTLSVSAFGIGISSSYFLKERWDMNKWTEAGKFENTWRGVALGSERYTAFEILVKTPQGGWPVWSCTAYYETA